MSWAIHRSTRARANRRLRAWRIGLPALALLLLPACASLGSPSTAHVARPGYECSVGEQGHGANVTLDEAGAQVRGSWQWRIQTQSPLLWISVSHTVEDATPLGANDGYVSINWARPTTGRERPPSVRMELASTPDNRYWYFTVPFAGEYASGQSSITTNWPDLATFARGAERLWLRVRNRRGQIADRVELDSNLVARGEAEIPLLLDQLRSVVADFRTRCRHVDDIDPEIILT